MRNAHDKLNGGSVARLARYRRNLAESLKTIRGYRTPEAAAAFIESAGYTSPLNHRYAWMGDTGGRDGRRVSGCVVLEHDGRGLVTYDDKEDAARAADALAESNAESAREYSERWSEANRADSAREEAREALRDARKEARDAISAARELCGRDGVERVRAILADRLAAARRDMRCALRDIASAAERIESLDMDGEF